MEFRASTEEDLPAIRALFASVFGANAPLLNEAQLRWKYFEPRPDWTGSRSYVMAQGKEVLAHGCAWPVTLYAGGEPFAAVGLIDWASEKRAAGAGILLARKFGQLRPVVLSIGGSEMTQQIMPKIGFETHGQLLSYARVLRPLRQFMTRPSRGPRAVGQLGRNWVWSLRAQAMERGWTAEPAANGDDFVLRCPGASIQSYALVEGGRDRGKAILSQVAGQARLARMAVKSGHAEDWAAAYSAVIEAARKIPGACELSALAHDARTRRALQENGFVERGASNVYVLDPGKRLQPRDYPLPLDMFSDDLYFLNVPEYPYLT